MNPFYEGPLRHFTENIRQACGTKGTPALPDILAEQTPAGATARQLFFKLKVTEQEIVADYCTHRLLESRWIKSQVNREVAKVILDEVCLSARGSAQELGLAFVKALSRVDAPWMRILVNLELAELLSRSHVYAPSCAIAYLRTFQTFEAFFSNRDYTRGPRHSLYEPLALAKGDMRLAEAIALEAVLPYGEDALRLLWGLQARDQEHENHIAAKLLRAEEELLSERLAKWLKAFEESPHYREHSWCNDLSGALKRSASLEGPTSVRLPDTSRCRAVQPFLDDARELLSSGSNEEAFKLLSLLEPSLARDAELESTTLRNHHLEAGYLRAVALYRLGSAQHCSELNRDNLRNLWTQLEQSYNEPGALWPKAVTETRLGAIHEIPKEWRFRPIRFGV